MLIGFFAIWLVLDRSASALHSLRGEAGLLVCALVIGSALAVERLVFLSHRTLLRGARQALRDLGFGRPGAGAMWAGLLVCLLMLAFYPIFSRLIGARLGLRGDWLPLSLGLFAQGGIAEEALFRGYLFRHLREGRPFWRAAFLSMLPFTAVHLLLFTSNPWPIALAATLLAVATSFPLAYLFERGGNTLWAPALLHFTMQGTFKLVLIPDALALPAAMAWMTVCLVAPWLVFAFGQHFFQEEPL